VWWPGAAGSARNADFAWLAIVLDRPRVERRAPSYGPCISEDRKRLPAILGSAKKPGRLAAHDGLGDRVWLVVDDVHELARRSRTSGSKKLQARIVAYRFVCYNLPVHPLQLRTHALVGEKYLRPGRYSCPDWARPRPGVPDHSVTYSSALRSSISLRPRSYHVTTWPRHWPTDSTKSPPACYPTPQALQPPRRQTQDVQFRRQTRRAPQPAPAHPRPRRHRDRRPHWRTVPINPPTKTRPSQP
jgi:hypothetical protein